MLLVRKFTLSNLTSARNGTNNSSCTQSPTRSDIGWVGPITLRRRAKPELENERHKDVSLRVSVQEVKNLTIKGRYFCEIRLDRILYARTTSKVSDGTVFWGEQFDLSNLPSISIVTINLFRQTNSLKGSNRQRNKSQNQFIAYITIPLTDNSTDLQKWFTMQSPQTNPQFIYSERLHNLSQSNVSNMNKPSQSTKDNTNPVNNASRVRKCSTPVNCFNYASITNNASHTKPQVDDTRLITRGNSRKKASWAAGDGQTQMIDQLKQYPSQIPSPVSPINPCGGENALNNDNSSLPQLRLNIHYSTTIVLPIQCYYKLKEFIKINYLCMIKLLEPKLGAKQKEELASCFVNLFEKLPDLSICQFLTDLFKEELNNNKSNKESMIFRSNSTCSKAVECYVKLIGNDYLHYLLRNVTEELLTVEDEFELDPSKIGNSNAGMSVGSLSEAALSARLEKNLTALIKYTSAIWHRIESSKHKLPRELLEVFATLATVVKEQCGSQAVAHLTSSCLFLRYICPAIHGPVLFGLASSVPENKRISRNLTLIAKVLQNLANLTIFEEKESHMKSVNKFLQQEIPLMQNFLLTISSISFVEHVEVTNANHHEYIDQGYEFAKLANILNSHLNELINDEQLGDLANILQTLIDLTDDELFYSWNSGHLTLLGEKKNPGPIMVTKHQNMEVQARNHSAHNSMPFLPVKQLYKQCNFVDQNQANYVNEFDLIEKPTVPNSFSNSSTDELTTICHNSSSKRSAWNPKSEFEFKDRNCGTTNYQSHNSSSTDNMDILLHRYREQLQQLNDCIDQTVVGPSDTIDSNRIVNSLNDDIFGTTSTNNRSQIESQPSDDPSLTNEHDEVNDHCGESSKSHNFITTNVITCHDQVHEDEGDAKHWPNTNRLYTPNQVARFIKVVHTDASNSPAVRSANSNTDIASDSEYDFDEEVRQRPEDLPELNCHTNNNNNNNNNFKNQKDATVKSRAVTRQMNDRNESGLSESPSLDQLAERLAELKKMLQLERQEIEEVVASKTQAIKQQEKSIQQLECELNQLRREHQPHVRSSSSSSSHCRYAATSKSTSRTVSPTSSFSSEFYSSNQSDIPQFYMLIPNNGNNMNPMHVNCTNTSVGSKKKKNNNNNKNNKNNNNNIHNPKVVGHISNNITSFNNNSLIDVKQMTSRRAQSFRDKICKYPSYLNDVQLRNETNLLYLSRTSEGTGIPLSHLIESNHHPKQIRRRLSESKLTPN